MLLLIVRKLVSDERNTLVEYQLNDKVAYKSALDFKERLKLYLLSEIGDLDTVTPEDIWAWSTAMREVVIRLTKQHEKNQRAF